MSRNWATCWAWLFLARAAAAGALHANKVGNEYYAYGVDVGGCEVTDWHNGTYTWGGDCDRVILQYENGTGALEPPTKQRWPNGKAVNQRVAQNKTEVIPKLCAIGDSLMKQFLYNDQNQARPQGPEEYHSTAWLLESSKFEERFLQPLRQLKGCGIIMMNSGVWDILTAEMYPGHLEHKRLLHALIDYARKVHPDARIVWKGMTAMHIHHAHCAPNDRRCNDRIKYMSSSRTSALDRIQRSTMKELGVPVIEMYETTFRGADYLRGGDGRHYNDTMNDILWFLATPIIYCMDCPA